MASSPSSDEARGRQPVERSHSSSSNSSAEGPQMLAPIPHRPHLPSRKSSGPLAVPRDSSEVGPVDNDFGPDDVRSMSPRKTSEDIEAMGRDARAELKM
jgi:hypothetical protein